MYIIPLLFQSLVTGVFCSADDMMMGFPIGEGAYSQADLDLCPQGARVIYTFLEAWRNRDYRTMYSLIDDNSKSDYPYNEAVLDFEFMEFREYNISSIRQKGQNFEFILSAGDWKYGDKEIRKVLISGYSYKILMNSRGNVFERSADSYF